MTRLSNGWMEAVKAARPNNIRRRKVVREQYNYLTAPDYTCAWKVSALGLHDLPEWAEKSLEEFQAYMSTKPNMHYRVDRITVGHRDCIQHTWESHEYV
jgi:hypothetical protein